MRIVNMLFGPNGNPWAELMNERARIVSANTGSIKPTVSGVNDHIANASRLDKSGKQTLTRLTSMADQFAPGNATLLRNIMGIAGIMQIGAKEERFGTNIMPYAKLLESRYLPNFTVDA